MSDQPDEAQTCFTDAVWTPRDGEIHLRCEECPKPLLASYRPSRYFHAIIDRARAVVTHCDGGIRIFDYTEAMARSSLHLREAGKVGARVKLFQLDGEIDNQLWSQLFQSLFIWNEDVRRFVAGLNAA